jgi:hypothetical protein
MPTTEGEKRKAEAIENPRHLWLNHEDKQWATDPWVFPEAHAKIKELGLRRSMLTGVIFAGGHHENDPQEIWVTEKRPANHLETEYTCVFVAPPWPPPDKEDPSETA